MNREQKNILEELHNNSQIKISRIIDDIDRSSVTVILRDDREIRIDYDGYCYVKTEKEINPSDLRI